MAGIPPQRLLDFRPRWTTIGASTVLAFDEKRGRILAAGTQLEAIGLEDGVSTPFGRGPWQETASDVHFTANLEHAIALTRTGEIVRWDASSGAVTARVPSRNPGASLEAVDATGKHGLFLLCELGTFRMFATNARLLLVDLHSGELVAELATGLLPALYRSATFLGDGRIVFCGRNGRASVRDPEGTVLHEFELPRPDPDDPSIDPSVRTVFSAGSVIGIADMLSVSTFDPGTGTRLWERPNASTPRNPFPSHHVLVLQISGFGGSQGSASLVDPRTGEETPFAGFTWDVAAVGNGVVVGADLFGNLSLAREGARVMDLARPLQRLTASASAITFRGDGALLVGGSDGSLRTVSPEGAMRALPAHGTNRITGVSFLADGKRATTLSPECHRTWRVDGGALEEEMLFPNASGDLRFSPDGAHFFGVRSGAVTVRSSIDGSVVAEAIVGDASTSDYSIALLDGATHLAGMSGGRVQRWSLATGKADAEHDLDERRRDMFANAGQAVAERGGRRLLVHSSVANVMLLWDPDSGEMREIPGVLGARFVLFADATRAVVVASRPSDTELTPWMDRASVLRLSDGAVLGDFEGHRAEITALAVSGDRIASTDAARQIAIWRMPPA